MVRMTGETTIKRPVDDVFDFLADARNEPKYNPIMRSAEKITDGPIGVGTQFREVSRSFGRDAVARIEMVGYEPHRRIEWLIHMPSTTIKGTLIFTAVPDGTAVRWIWDVETHGALKLLTPLIARVGQRQEERTWARLKAYLEAQPAVAAPVWRPGPAGSGLNSHVASMIAGACYHTNRDRFVETRGGQHGGDRLSGTRRHPDIAGYV